MARLYQEEMDRLERERLRDLEEESLEKRRTIDSDKTIQNLDQVYRHTHHIVLPCVCIVVCVCVKIRNENYLRAKTLRVCVCRSCRTCCRRRRSK